MKSAISFRTWVSEAAVFDRVEESCKAQASIVSAPGSNGGSGGKSALTAEGGGHVV